MSFGIASPCRGEVRQLVVDRGMLRSMHSAALAARNHVEAFFCDCLLAAVRELLPDDVEPTGADLRATVIINSVEGCDVPDVTPEEELLAALAQLVEGLKVRHPTLVFPCCSGSTHTQAALSAGCQPQDLHRLQPLHAISSGWTI